MYQRYFSDAGQELMRALDEQIDHIDDLLWELLDNKSDRHDGRVLQDARKAASGVTRSRRGTARSA